MSLIWPILDSQSTKEDLRARGRALEHDFCRALVELGLSSEDCGQLAGFYLPLVDWLAQQSSKTKPLVVGINGAQGSGKSTLCSLLALLLEKEFSLSCAVLSIDDLYFSKVQRQRLAKQIHPLLETRGVPGTHDVELGLKIFESLNNATASSRTAIPRFDKALDDSVPEHLWDSFRGVPDLILFEGWCVGAVAQPDTMLTEPINLLEVEEDAETLWRCYVNQCLREDYAPLFEKLDLLLMLKIPRWEMVLRWRSKQEEQLASKRSGTGVMDESALQRFIMHYERLTRYQLEEMPLRADLVFELSEEQRVVNIIKKNLNGLGR